MNNYQIYDEIGKGRNSTVYKGRRKKTIEYYAIASIDKRQRPRVLNSVQLLRSLNHVNVLQFHNWYETTNHLWVITELCTGGDLRGILVADKRLPEQSIRILTADIADGLSYMHSRGVLYMDLKPSNVLLDATGRLRFYDFGLSMNFTAAGKGDNGRVGTPTYMAPELFDNRGVPSMASDMWSFGCMLFELASGEPPFVGDTLEDLITNIISAPVPTLTGVSAALAEVVGAMLRKNPAERATWAEVQNSEVFPNFSVATSYPPQPQFEAFLRQLQADDDSRAITSRESKKRQTHDVLRASINAERNMNKLKAIRSEAPPSEKKAKAVDFDREVDFRDPDAVEKEAVAAEAASMGATIGGIGEADADAHHTTLPQAAPSTTPVVDRSLSIEDLLVHPLDAHLRPLVSNNRIERYAEPRFEPEQVPLKTISALQLRALPKASIEEYLTSVYQVLTLQSPNSKEERLATILYFQTLCTDANVAETVVNCSLMGLFSQLVGSQAMSSQFRLEVATAMGLLVRHADYIDAAANSSLIASLLQVLPTEGNIKVRRRVLACTGELLFYIATRSPGQRNLWQVDGPAVLGVFTSAIGDTDDVLVHYAAKMIENTASIGDLSAAISFSFTSPALVKAMLSKYDTLAEGSPKTEHLRVALSCASLKLCLADVTLCRTVLSWPSMVPEVFLREAGRPDSIKHNAKTIQSYLTCLVGAAAHVITHSERSVGVLRQMSWRRPESSPHSLFAVRQGDLLGAGLWQSIADALTPTSLRPLLEHSASPIRGKAALLIGMVMISEGAVATSKHTLGSFVSTAAPTHAALTGLHRDRDVYVCRCGDATFDIVRVVGALLLHNTAASRVFASERDVLPVSENLEVVRCVLTREYSSRFVSQKTITLIASLSRLIHRAAEVPSLLNIIDGIFDCVERAVQVAHSEMAGSDDAREFDASVASTLLPSLLPLLDTYLKSRTESTLCSLITLIHDVLVPVFSHTLEEKTITGVSVFCKEFSKYLSLVLSIQSATSDLLSTSTVRLLGLICEHLPVASAWWRSTTVLDALMALCKQSKTLAPSVLTLVVRLLRTQSTNPSQSVASVLASDATCDEALLRHCVTKHGLLQWAMQSAISAEQGPWESAEGVVTSLVEVILLVVCVAARDPTSEAAMSCGHLVAGEHTALESLLLGLCARHNTSAAAEFAASCVLLVVQLFEEARQLLERPRIVAQLRAILSDGANPTDSPLMTQVPLLRSLIVVARISPKRLQCDEVLLIILNKISTHTTVAGKFAGELLRLLLQ